VAWRTELTPPPPGGGEPGLTVIAQVSMPARPLNLTMEIRRNFDASAAGEPHHRHQLRAGDRLDQQRYH